MHTSAGTLPRRRGRRISAVLTVSLFAAGLNAPPSAAQDVPPCSRTYTSDADFDEGALLNVNHDPDHDQLQLNAITEPFPFVYIANSARGTAVRIDVNTGQILGEYFTAPTGQGRNPSRTTVDKLGNVWVSNRDEAQGGKGSVVRIGLVRGPDQGRHAGHDPQHADQRHRAGRHVHPLRQPGDRRSVVCEELLGGVGRVAWRSRPLHRN